MTNNIYIHQPEKAFSFTRLPNFLFEAPTFKPLSNEAKVLYAFILRRTELSRKNGWADEYGRIYLYYPICEVVDLLRCGPESGKYHAGTAICRIGGDPEAGLWKTQPHLPKILRSGSKHRLQEIRLWNTGGLKTALHKYDNQSS